MSVPKKKISKTRTRSRRAHHAISTPASAECTACGAVIQPHRACLSCGMYRGKKVMNVKSRAAKKVATTPETATEQA